MARFHRAVRVSTVRDRTVHLLEAAIDDMHNSASMSVIMNNNSYYRSYIRRNKDKSKQRMQQSQRRITVKLKIHIKLNFVLSQNDMRRNK